MLKADPLEDALREVPEKEENAAADPADAKRVAIESFIVIV